MNAVQRIHEFLVLKLFKNCLFLFCLTYIYVCRNSKTCKHLFLLSHCLFCAQLEPPCLFSLCRRIPVLRLRVRFSWLFTLSSRRIGEGTKRHSATSALHSKVGVPVLFSHDITVLFFAVDVLFWNTVHVWTTSYLPEGNMAVLQDYILLGNGKSACMFVCKKVLMHA